MWLTVVLCVVSWPVAGGLMFVNRRYGEKKEKKKFFEKLADGILFLPIGKRFYRETVKRLLMQIYPTGEEKELCRMFYRKKLTLGLKIWFLGIHFLMLFAAIELLQSELAEESYIQRGTFGESEKNVVLEVRSDGVSQEEILYRIQAQRYTPEEMKEFVNRFTEECETLVLGKNESLKEITSDLCLCETYEGFPMQISWESSNYSLIEEDGTVHNETLSKRESVTLTAVLVYEEEEYRYSFAVGVCPKALSPVEQWRHEIMEAIREADEKQKYTDKLWFPSEIAGKKVSYTEVRETSGPWYLLLLAAVVMLLFWAADNDLKKEAEKRKRTLSLKYPEFVSKFRLLLGAGMTVRNTIWRLSEDASLGEELGQELRLLVRDMKNGLAVKDALEKFGKRCAHPLYMKFAALITQNLKKGTGELLDQLSGEAAEAFYLRKTQARQLGEEAGTKLLGPMILMLAVVMAVLIIPAFLSFQM